MQFAAFTEIKTLQVIDSATADNPLLMEMGQMFVKLERAEFRVICDVFFSSKNRNTNSKKVSIHLVSVAN